jgi:hypothetical protein
MTPHAPARVSAHLERGSAQAPGTRLSRAALRSASPLEHAALVYLSLPLLIFFLGFAAWAIAAAAAVVIVATLYRLRPHRPIAVGISGRQLLLCAALAAIYLWCCSYVPPSGRTWDWIKHFAVINELGQHSWPPVRDDRQTFLRYYLGYYMVPGLIVRWIGSRYIEWLVLVQTWLGLLLLLALLVQKIRPRRAAFFLTLFLLFSGLDLLGTALIGDRLSLLAHKEWWAGAGGFSYQGHATLFLNVPQHALGGLIGLMVLLPHSRDPPAAMAGLLGVAVAFWSPFAALGLLPFMLVILLPQWRKALLDRSNILCAAVLGIPLTAYLLSGAGGIPHGVRWRWDSDWIALLALFLALEVGLYLVALHICCWKALRYPYVVIGVLLLLPLYHVGVYNDFTMRASIPALALIAVAAAQAVSEARGAACIPLATLMLVGSAASVLEMVGRARDGSVPARQVSLRSGFLNDDPRFFVQYNAPLPHWVLRR